MSAPLPEHPQSPGVERARGPVYSYAPGSQPLPGYTIKRGLGQGGFGEVYYALSDAGKEVALKVVRRNLEVELRGVTQCLNLKHPNLVALYDVRTDAEDNYWIVMEYVGGERLVELIERHPQGLPPAEAVRLLREIGAAVAYLHDNGIVHRDLKPANIFVENGRVKIGDYGLSKFISVSRRSGQTESVGTVHYMAPEISNGRYGKQIDVYALGVLLYELLTGRVPFDGESVGEILMKHLTAEPDLSAAPPEYRAAIAGALEKDPQRRTATVDDFLAAVGVPDDTRAAIVATSAPRHAARGAGRRGRAAEGELGWHHALLLAPIFGVFVLIYIFRSGDSPLQHSSLMSGILSLSAVLLVFVVLPIRHFARLERERQNALGYDHAARPLARRGTTAAEPPSYGWMLVPPLLVGLLFLFAARTGAVLPWIVLWPPLVIAGGFTLWIGNWTVRRHRRLAAVDARPTHAPKAAGAVGWAVVAAFVAIFVALLVSTTFWSHTAVSVQPAQVAGRAQVETRQVAITEATADQPPPSGEPPFVSYRELPPVPVPVETRVFSLGIGLLSVIGVSFGLMFWLARRGREHYDPTAVVQARRELASTQLSVDAASARGPPVSWRERLIDMTGALLIAFVASVVGMRLLLLVRGGELETGQYLWTAAATFAGVSLWIVLLKSGALNVTDGLTRRGLAMVVGVLAGAAAWAFARFLEAPLPMESNFEGVGPDRWPECYEAGRPTIVAFVGYFALVFAVLDWWGMTSPLRRTRWRLADPFIAFFWAFLVHMIFPFPQLWGALTIAGVAAILPLVFRPADRAERVRLRMRDDS